MSHISKVIFQNMTIKVEGGSIYHHFHLFKKLLDFIYYWKLKMQVPLINQPREKQRKCKRGTTNFQLAGWMNKNKNSVEGTELHLFIYFNEV